MIKSCYIEDFDGPFWPTPEQIAPYFLGGINPPWVFPSRNDSWGLKASGLQGTAALPEDQQIQVHFYICGRWDQGNYLVYSRVNRQTGAGDYIVSKGNLSRRLEFIETGHGDLLSAGLFIPFVDGWRAVKGFIESNGELPDAIEWVNINELPPDTLVDLGDRERIKKMQASGQIIEDINPPEAIGGPVGGIRFING